MSPDSDNERRIDSLRTREPGEHESDPYDDVDISELPGWWREAIEEHEEYGLRPYRPPRFEDDVLKYEVVSDLEEKHGIEITFMGVHVSFEDDWMVLVDEKEISSIGRYRDASGHTVFEMESGEFVDLVERHVAETS